MKFLKIFAIVVAALIAIPLIIALFVKREYSVEREVTINRPKQEVFNFIRNLKNQDQYNKWIMMDPDMKKNFKGTDGTEGFIYAWNGEKAGKGEQEISSITEGEKIETELRFIEPMEGFATAKLTTESMSADQTKIRWGMKGESKYPMNFMNLFMNSMLGKDLQTSLLTLKNTLEK